MFGGLSLFLRAISANPPTLAALASSTAQPALRQAARRRLTSE
jgi:hypothetical protein